MKKRIAIIIACGCVFIVFEQWFLYLRPTNEFKQRFTAPVVAVEVKGNKQSVAPYLISDRASFGWTRVYSVTKHSNRSSTVVFHLQDGGHVDCVYCWITDGRFCIAPAGGPPNGPYLKGANLWPDMPGDVQTGR